MDIKTQNNLLVVFFSGFFLFVCLYFFSNADYRVLSIPLILATITLSIFNFKYLFYCVVFLTPLSMSLSDMGIDFSDVNMAFPTEPILFGLMILTILKIVFYPSLFKQVFQHRVTFFILLYLFWILVTCITSSMPIVSIKLLLTRLWYIVPVFFIGSLLFQNKKNVDYFILSYLIPLTIVVIYTVTRHSGYLFDKESAHYMMSPFFNDHTSYGAMIAFFLPLSIAFFWIKKHNIFFSFFMISIILILTIGLILSFTRAAWISLFISVIVGLFLKFKINKKILYSLPLLGFIFLLSFQNPILNLLESNRQDSSDNLIEHITSLSNISTDASNMERINRWKCALKMFVEKPFFGWGPGTYQFQYARFQLSSDRTIISSNMGDMGNAHSEYLGPLSESGFFGFLSFLILMVVTIIYAINMYYESNDSVIRTWLLAIIVALLSYAIHGLFNNFLDTDKASVAIWGVVAIIVGLDLLKDEKQSQSTVIS